MWKVAENSYEQPPAAMAKGMSSWGAGGSWEERTWQLRPQRALHSSTENMTAHPHLSSCSPFYGAQTSQQQMCVHMYALLCV